MRPLGTSLKRKGIVDDYRKGKRKNHRSRPPKMTKLKLKIKEDAKHGKSRERKKRKKGEKILI